MVRRALGILALALLAVPTVSCKKKSRLKEPDDPQLRTRVHEARKLLAEAGYPEGKGFPKLEILYNTSENHKLVATFLQQQWKDWLGIEVELSNKEWKVYLDLLSKLNYQAARRGWIGDFPDPYTFLELMKTGGGNNNTGWGNAEFDRLMKESAAESDPAKRMAHMMKAEKILMDEMPVIPIYFYVSQNMWKPEVKGLTNNILNIHPIAEVVKGDGSGTLVLNNHTEIASLDPGISRGVSEHRVQICVFEGLMNYHPETLKPVPGVAERHEESQDRRTYTFHLRDCQWSDGMPVRAQDFAYAWKRVLDPKTASDYAHMMYVLKNGEKFNKGEAGADAVGVRAKDDRTLVVELENPVPYFLDLLPFFTFYPVRQDVIEKHGSDWTKPGKFVGNGAFALKDWVTNQHILLVRNEKYWNAGVVKQREVKWLPTEDYTTALNMYLAGQCDYLDSVPLDQIDQLKTRADYHAATYLGTYYFSLNVNVPALKDPRVRRALSLAIDREKLCRNVLKGGQQPAYHFVPTGFEDRGYKSEPFVK